MNKNMSPLKWGCCAVGSDDDAFARCVQCKKVFHYDCLQTVDLRGNDDVPGWKCPLCKKYKRGNNDNMPVSVKPIEPSNRSSESSSRSSETLIKTAKPQNRGAEPPSKSSETFNNDHVLHKSKKRAAPSLTPEKNPVNQLTDVEVRNIFREIMREERAELMSELKKNMIAPLTSEIRDMKEEIKGFKHSMEFISAQYEEIKDECKSNSNAVAIIQENQVDLQMSMTKFESRVNQLEQQVRLCNVEIQCVPENRNENLLTVVAKLCETIGCDISNKNIERCTRIAKINRSNDRPRSIIVQFNNRNSKDNFLASVIKHNKLKPGDKLNTSHIGFSGERKPIYVMEHLSPYNKSLHAATRLKAKELGYKFVWVRDGKIFVRKTEESSFIVINSPASLDKLV